MWNSQVGECNAISNETILTRTVELGRGVTAPALWADFLSSNVGLQSSYSCGRQAPEMVNVFYIVWDYRYLCKMRGLREFIARLKVMPKWICTVLNG